MKNFFLKVSLFFYAINAPITLFGMHCPPASRTGMFVSVNRVGDLPCLSRDNSDVRTSPNESIGHSSSTPCTPVQPQGITFLQQEQKSEFNVAQFFGVPVRPKQTLEEIEFWAKQKATEDFVKKLLLPQNMHDVFSKGVFSDELARYLHDLEEPNNILHNLDLIGDAVLNGRYYYGFTMAHYLVERNNVEGLKILAKNHRVNLNRPSYHDGTPLARAAYLGHAACVEFLLSCESVDVNFIDRHGNSALYWAIRGGHAEVIKLFLDPQAYPYYQRIYVNEQWSDGSGLLQCAVAYGNRKAVELLLRFHSNALNAQDIAFFCQEAPKKGMKDLWDSFQMIEKSPVSPFLWADDQDC